MVQSEKKYVSLDHLSGKLLREIRESKGYTQQYVSKGIVRQSTYSKIEREETEPSASRLFMILERLEVSVGEFLFIQGDYTHTEKGNIVYAFINRKYYLPKILRALKKDVDRYLDKNDDVLIKDIQSIYNGLIILSSTRDIKLARRFVEPVWNRIESFNEWRLTEIYLVNNILYFFHADSAIHITNRAITQLEKYKDYSLSTTLRFNFKFNLIYLLLDNKQYHQTLVELESLIPYAKELKKHDMLAVCYARQGVAMTKSGQDSGQDWIEKGLHMLEVIEELELKEQIEQEIENFLN